MNLPVGVRIQIQPITTSVNTIAEVTFYGRDQTGAELNATGTITVNFADWADPESATS